MKKLLLKITFVFFSCFLTSVIHAEENENIIKLSVTEPKIDRYVEVLNIPGIFVAKNEISIGSPLQQQMVTAVFVEEGQWVEKNQLLATLESPLQTAAVMQLKAETEKATAYIQQQKVLAEQAQKELTRLSALANKGVISANDFEKAKSETLAKKAKSETLAKKAELEAIRAELRQLNAQLAREQSQEDKSKIIAPVAGVISERHAMNGTLSDNALLFKIIENNEIEFEANAHLSELSQINHSSDVKVKDYTNKELSGVIRFISSKIDTYSQLGKIRVSLTDKHNHRIGEMGVMVYTQQPQQRMTLPYSAIRTEANGIRNIFIVNHDRRIEIQSVDIGGVYNGRVEILSPLSTDIKVVAYAQAFLSQGDLVVPMKDIQ
ncbi:efflux RND transporter periplasmic adaptor subunit [Proteus terrae]|uniref:efflux RND transporter periplasmic adaptor subunit n=1 Tax=Proteus terrae TaxID=1574161 RepID=UPI00288B2BA7|nr:efflux RND transporter periplasmic adaptor subunit [Proteus terrae]